MVKPYLSSVARLSWVMGFSYILVFIAGATILGASLARMVVVSMSSAMPWASLAITLAVAGATRMASAAWAREMCCTWNSKFRSKVSVIHLCPVRVSKVMGLIKFTACSVMITRTSAPAFISRLARAALL